MSLLPNRWRHVAIVISKRKVVTDSHRGGGDEGIALVEYVRSAMLGSDGQTFVTMARQKHRLQHRLATVVVAQVLGVE